MISVVIYCLTVMTSPIDQPVASTRLPSIVPCGTPSSSSSRSRSTPATTPLSRVKAGCSDHEGQFDAFQRKLVLTEKIDNLQGQQSAPAMAEKGKVKTFHEIWRFNDDTNLEVTQAIERGVRVTSAFREADPVISERALVTCFKTLKAKIRGVVKPCEERGTAPNGKQAG